MATLAPILPYVRMRAMESPIERSKTVNHTPGPWTVFKSPVRKALLIHAKDDLLVADLGDDETGTQEANARLIAAAPDLLAALSELVAEWDNDHADEDHQSGITPETGGIILARMAIAKAEGRDA